MDENATKLLVKNIPNLPSRNFIENVDSLIKECDQTQETNGKLNFLSDEENFQYYLYKFVESLIVIIGELRYEAECYADHIRDQINFRLDGILPLNWKNVVKSFTPGSEPPMELIVQIATGYRSDLFKLTSSPRKILRQFHQKEHLSKVQRIDPRCLIWLTRQSGRDTIEKAGSRQQILSVVRKETFDTLENRVLKKMVELSRQKSFIYYQKHRDKFGDTPRFKTVRLFASETQNILMNEKFSGIGLLLRSPKPNYVLMFDAKYREMWNWYSRLVRQQQETEAAWVWQRELFADWCRLATTVGILGVAGCRKLFDHELWIRNMPNKGTWIEESDWPNALLIKVSGVVWLVEIDHVEEELFSTSNYFSRKIMRLKCSRPDGKKRVIDIFTSHNPGNDGAKELNHCRQEIEKITKDDGIVLYSRILLGDTDNPSSIGKIAMIIVNGQDAEMASHTSEKIKNQIERLLS